MAEIKTDSQLKAKLINYNFSFTSDEFDRLKHLGYYHVFNSFVEKSVRINGSLKKLSTYLDLYSMDVFLRSLLFPLIIEIESLFKQRFNDSVIEILRNNSILNPNYNMFVKFCVVPNDNIKAKKILFKGTNDNAPIVIHFFNKHEDIPTWGYLELLSFGDFLLLFDTCTRDLKKLMIFKCGFTTASSQSLPYDGNDEIVKTIGVRIKHVRNSIAHNQPIFDCRFCTGNVNANVFTRFIQTLFTLCFNKYGVTSSFDPSLTYSGRTITDYLVLIYLLYVFLEKKDTHSNSLLVFCDQEIKLNHQGFPLNIHSCIFGQNNLAKVNELSKF